MLNPETLNPQPHILLRLLGLEGLRFGAAYHLLELEGEWESEYRCKNKGRYADYLGIVIPEIGLVEVQFRGFEQAMSSVL